MRWRTLGPSVTWTASASFSTPARTAPRQSTPNLTSFAAKFRTLPYWLHAFVHESLSSASTSIVLIQWHRRCSVTSHSNSYSTRCAASPYHFLEDTLSSLPTASDAFTIARFRVHHDSDPSRASFDVDPFSSALVRARRFFESTTATTSVGIAPCAVFRADFFRTASLVLSTPPPHLSLLLRCRSAAAARCMACGCGVAPPRRPSDSRSLVVESGLSGPVDPRDLPIEPEIVPVQTRCSTDGKDWKLRMRWTPGIQWCRVPQGRKKGRRTKDAEQDRLGRTSRAMKRATKIRMYMQGWEGEPSSDLGRSASLDRLVVFGEILPVDHVPEVGNVLGPSILVLQIVSVLPHIQTKNRSAHLLGQS